MTARAAFTEAQLRRAMRAAKKEGCAVELRPDGRMIVHSAPADLSIAPDTPQSEEVDTWADR